MYITFIALTHINICLLIVFDLGWLRSECHSKIMPPVTAFVFLISLLTPFGVTVENFIPELALHRVGDTNRHCFTVRVPQDHEYIPCEKPYGNDTYTKCPNYTYQPDSASSSIEPQCIDPSCSPEDTRVKEISKDGRRILRCVCDLNKKYCGTDGNDCKKVNESCVGKTSQDCSCRAPENGVGRLEKWPETNWSLPKQQGDPLIQKQKEETSNNSPYWVAIVVFVGVCCCSVIWYNRKIITKKMRSGLKRNRSVQLTTNYGRMQCEHTNERLSEENKTANDRNIDRSVLHCNASSNGLRNVLVSQNYVSQSGRCNKRSPPINNSKPESQFRTTEVHSRLTVASGNLLLKYNSNNGGKGEVLTVCERSVQTDENNSITLELPTVVGVEHLVSTRNNLISNQRHSPSNAFGISNSHGTTGGSAKTATKPVAKVFPQRITTQPMHSAEYRHQETLQTDVQSNPPFDNVESLHLSSLDGDPVTQN